MPFYSIVIPVFNGERFILDALDSVARQSFRSWECIVVDDGSEDRSFALIQEWSRKEGIDVRLLRHHDHGNHGVAASRNLAISHAKGEWIAFLDQDDLWAPEKLELQHAFILEEPEVDAVSCQPDLIYLDFNTSTCMDVWGNAIAHPDFAKQQRVSFDSFLTGCPYFLSGAVVRARTFRHMGGFNADLPHTSDWLFWACLASRRPLGFIPLKLATYRFHGSNSMMEISGEPFGLALALLEIRQHLIRWICEDRAMEEEAAARFVDGQTDWSGAARHAGISSSDVWRILAGNG